MQFPYDPDNPPADPPPGSDRLVWRLAHQIHRDHQPDQHRWCVVCRPIVDWPCDPYRLARAAMLAATYGYPPSVIQVRADAHADLAG